MNFKTYYVREITIKSMKIATGSPQANGQVERINRILVPMIAKLSDDSIGKWCKTLTDVEYALSNTVSKTTGYTPSQLLFGVGQRGNNIDRLKDYLNQTFETEPRDINKMRDIASNKTYKLQIYNKRYINKRRKETHI